MKKKMLTFNVSTYGTLEQYNDLLSKARCKIFYKYGNRNGTYITDDFAEQLISTLAYVPVKGIYEEGEDYTDHGNNRDEGKIYGIVPESHNFRWETHLDEDGVAREYACVDVLLYTSLYDEAKDIIGKPQSMELFAPTLKYHFEYIDGVKWAVFDKGSFLGLQVLGEDVEPCFEGAAFYNLQESIRSIVKRIEEYSLEYEQRGGKEMNKINFKLSDDQKFQALWALLNTEYNEENDWAVNYGIVAVYDEYAIVVSYEDGKYERVYYTKNDDNDSVIIDKREACYIVDVNAEEKAVLQTLKTLNGETYEVVKEDLTGAEENAKKVEELSTKNAELDTSLSTLTSERNSLQSEKEEADSKLESLTEELDGLKEYRHEIETNQKKEVLSEYGARLSEDVLKGYEEKLDSYTVLELDKELAFELKKSNPSVFDLSPTTQYVPKDEPTGGIEEILLKYKK